jgi:putative two-component system response regulator
VAADDFTERVGTVLLVDDEEAITDMLERLLVARGYLVLTARDGQEALDVIDEIRPDVVLSDVRMPRRDGFTLCHDLKHNPATRFTSVVLMTGAAEREDRIRAIEAGADEFLTKPVDPEELLARVRSLVRLKRQTDDLESAEAVVVSLALTVEARDPYTDGHCQRLGAYGMALGRRLRLGADELADLRLGGFVHDLGKIAIPDAILTKPGPLTPEEFATMKQHPVVGARLCGNLRVLTRVRSIVRYHHERLDGSGYPDGLRGDAIPLLAQIIAVADVYDAVTTARSYKEARPSEAGYQALLDDAQKGKMRRDLVDEFVAAGQAGELKALPPGRDR